MAVNKPVGENARKGAVRKRSQIKTKVMGEDHWTKRNKEGGRFMDQKADDKKFKGVRREKKSRSQTRNAGPTSVADLKMRVEPTRLPE